MNKTRTSNLKTEAPVLIEFDPQLTDLVLKSFGKTVNREGCVIDSEGEVVLSARGEQLKRDQFGGVIKGSEIYLQKDIDSVLRFVEANLAK